MGQEAKGDVYFWMEGIRKRRQTPRMQKTMRIHRFFKLRLVIPGLSGDWSICLPILLSIRSVNVSGLADIPKTGRTAILIQHVATFKFDESCMMRGGPVEAIASENLKIDLST
jgi:hypothetical protein